MTAKGKLETPRRGVLFFATPLAVLLAVFMFFFFLTDEWTAERVIGQLGFTAIAVGLVIATVSPERGAWGI